MFLVRATLEGAQDGLHAGQILSGESLEGRFRWINFDFRLGTSCSAPADDVNVLCRVQAVHEVFAGGC